MTLSGGGPGGGGGAVTPGPAGALRAWRRAGPGWGEEVGVSLPAVLRMTLCPFPAALGESAQGRRSLALRRTT